MKIKAIIHGQFGTNLIILTLYTILSIIFTYPVSFDLNMSPGVIGDSFTFLWYFWWIKNAILSGINIYYTNYIFYPTGINLAFSDLSLFNDIVSIPIQYFFTLVVSYNLIWIFTFIASGFGAFLLGKYVLDDSKAAFLCGLIYAFCPYRFAHALGHLNLISVEWIPLFVLFFIKTTREENLLNPIFSAVSLLLVTISSYYYFIYVITFSFLYLIYYQLSERILFNKDLPKRVLIIFILSAILISPILYPLVLEMINSKSDYMYAGGSIEFSADLLGFFLPTTFHPIFKDLVAPIYANFTGGITESTVFVGYSVLLLSLIAFIKIKRNDIRFWGISGIIYFLLSLGPVLHINGVYETYLYNIKLFFPLPYELLMKIPILSLARVPSRWDIMLMLSLSLLSGFGLKYIFTHVQFDSIKNINSRYLMTFFFSILILFEFLSIPYPMVSDKIPAFYDQIARDQNNYAIIEVPIIGDPVSTYRQTLHEKWLVGGYTSRIPDESLEFIQSTSFISQLFYFQYDDILKQDLTKIAPSLLNYYKIRYIIVNKDRLTPEQFEFASNLLNSSLNKNRNVYEDGSVIVYEVEESPIESFVSLVHGFYGKEYWNGKPTRWMKDEGELNVYSEKNCTTTLTFRALSFYRPRKVEIYLGNTKLNEAYIPVDFVNVSTSANLKKGINTMRFYVPDGCDSPANIPLSENQDKRCMSLAIRNIKFNI